MKEKKLILAIFFWLCRKWEECGSLQKNPDTFLNEEDAIYINEGIKKIVVTYLQGIYCYNRKDFVVDVY